MGGNSKTPRRKSPTTKFWNTNLGQLPSDESLSFDFEDQGKTRLCGVKLRSNRLEKWIGAHKDTFGESFERTKKTVVTWKDTPGTSSMAIQTASTANKGKRLLSVHFYHKKQGLMVQGQYTKWWMDKLYPELVKNINSQVDMQTRSTIKDGAQRVLDAIDSFPATELEPTTPMQDSQNNGNETPTVVKSIIPRTLQGLETPESTLTDEQMSRNFENGARPDEDIQPRGVTPVSTPTVNVAPTTPFEKDPAATPKSSRAKTSAVPLGERLESVEKSLKINETAFDDLQKQFVDTVGLHNTLKDDLISNFESKERDREEACTQTLKRLTMQVEATQKSLEAHIKSAIKNLQNDLHNAQKDLAAQRADLKKERQEASQEALIDRQLLRERVHDMSIKVDTMAASNAELQDFIKIQDAEIQFLSDRYKELETKLESCHCRTIAKDNTQPGMNHREPLHNKATDCNTSSVNTTTAIHDNRPGTVANQGNNAPSAGTTQDNKSRAPINTTRTVNDAKIAPSGNKHIVNQNSDMPSLASGARESPGNNGGFEVRIFADSIFRDVDVQRAFRDKPTKMYRNSTVVSATASVQLMKDPSTKLVILHVGSNDLDNSKHKKDSVSETVKNTQKLLDATKVAFPNAQVAVSQVLQRGPNSNTTLNLNIKEYNQEILKLSRNGNFTYIKHRKLTQDRRLYLPDQIHIDPRSGTKLLVSDVIRTLNPVPGLKTERQQPTWTNSQSNRHVPNQYAPWKWQPRPMGTHNTPAHGRGMTRGQQSGASPVPVSRRRNPPSQLTALNPTRQPSSLDQTPSTTTVARPAWLPTANIPHHVKQWKQLGKRLRKVWDILVP
ncbi:hypothetical protein Bbelb_442080 [Branchiostoma belcheri]|nr:hypothetical protein Bbelb_442080 [Branchiostoma belcheri]